MQAFYHLRGCTLLLRLFTLQALIFVLIMMVPVWMPALTWSASSLGRLLPAWVLLALVCLFAEKVWTALSEPIFCLGGTQWGSILTFALRPLLWLAPFATVLSSMLEVYAPHSWWAAAPALIVGACGLTVCSYLILTTWPLLSELRRSRHTVTSHLEELRALHGSAAVQRLSDTLQYAFALTNENPFQMRRGVNVPDLPSRAWHERSAFPWAAEFERRFDAIRTEALRATNSLEVRDYHYPGAVSGSWKTFWLVRNGEIIFPNAAACPETMRAMQAVPGFPRMREAHFSILHPGSRIKPHCDESNVWLTGHFGIKIPEACGIRVGREVRKWREGQFMFFDTSYQHECWNDSDQPRVVLLFDFLHPQLSEVERDFFGGHVPASEEPHRWEPPTTVAIEATERVTAH